MRNLTKIVPEELVEEYLFLKGTYAPTAKYTNARRYLLKRILEGASSCKKEELIVWRNFHRIALRDLSK